MKKRILLLFLLISSIEHYAGGEPNLFSPSPFEFHRFHLGFSISPDYSFRELQTDLTTLETERKEKFDIPKLGFTGGITLLFQPIKRVSFETGLFYANKGEKSEKIDTTYLNNNAGNTPNDFTITENYKYIDIPIKMNIYILTGNFQLFVSGSITTNILTAHETVQELFYYNSTQTTTTKNNDKFAALGLSSQIGVGIDLGLTDLIYFRAEPTYRQSLTSITNSTASYDQFLKSTGIYFGLFIKL